MEKVTSEIVKLTERIASDPKSKLFVPLAEEYKKAGDIEMAIHVLSEGLKHNPGYVTARSFLGRLLFDQGDIAASLAEFEEVIKAIPDNLFARKKLGDLYLFQNRRDDALTHYKVALSLNPGDAEIASLVSDIEAGVDVRERLPQPKQKPASEPAAPTPPQQPTPQATHPLSEVAAAPTTTAGSTAVSQKTPEPASESVPPAEEQKAYEWPEPGERTESAIPTGETSPLAGMAFEEEEAEEVLVVEPLEEGPSDQETADEGFGFLKESGGEADEAVAEPRRETAPMPSANVFEEPEGFTTDGEAGTAFAAGPVDESEPIAASAGETQQPPEQADADDFTTDTLAELYIAQGFYEKAIDIYQRMLADKPNSRGLKDKLERVRAMAESGTEKAPAPAEQPARETAAALFEEPQALGQNDTNDEEIAMDAELFVEPEEEATRTAPAGAIDENVFAETGARPAEEEQGSEAGPGGRAVDDIFMPPPQEEFGETKPQDTEFVPREYIPPTAVPVAQKETNVPVGPKAASAGRKETIDRLETWLKNIKKET